MLHTVRPEKNTPRIESVFYREVIFSRHTVILVLFNKPGTYQRGELRMLQYFYNGNRENVGENQENIGENRRLN